MKGARLIIGSMLLLGLTACDGSGDFSDLQAYMNEVRAKPKGVIEPLPQFQPYEAFTYSAAAMRHPFQPPVRVDLQKRQKGSAEIKPDESRPKQFLEGFNIEMFQMVGLLANDGGRFALVSGVGGVHRVKVGDYIGRNYGRIVAINDDRIEVVEIVTDGEGGWLERPRTLTLKERS
ncbi:Pilus assembly protein, PilP [compost metagenome]